MESARFPDATVEGSRFRREYDDPIAFGGVIGAARRCRAGRELDSRSKGDARRSYGMLLGAVTRCHLMAREAAGGPACVSVGCERTFRESRSSARYARIRMTGAAQLRGDLLRRPIERSET